MNLETMNVPPAEASTKLFAIERLMRQGRETPADVLLLAAYEAARQGATILDANAAIAAGGWNDDGTPKLAIARADTREDSDRWVHYYRDTPRRALFRSGVDRRNGDANRGPFWTTAIAGQIPRRVSAPGGIHMYETPRAMIPHVPAEHRPPLKLSNYHILFEAEWSEAPPVDPVLLKHIRGPFYAVLASWDLTELERAAMREVITP